MGIEEEEEADTAELDVGFGKLVKFGAPECLLLQNHLSELPVNRVAKRYQSLC